jgi:hypothetical protein
VTLAGLAACLIAGCGERRTGVFARGSSGPVAALEAWPRSGSTATVFALDASGSSDPQGAGGLTVRWDFESDGVWDTPWSAAKTASAGYASPGTYTVTVEVRGATGLVDSAEVQLDVLGDGPYTLASPTGGEEWWDGDSAVISWTPSGGSDDVVIDISRDGGSTWETLATAPDTGSYSWSVAGPTSSECIIRLHPESDPLVADQSEEAFMVYSPDRTVVLADVSPVTTERWLDIAGNEYGDPFKTTYDYSAAAVTVSWCSRAPSFVGKLAATDLKPNFAYQVKLCGIRDSLQSFERIGYLGRWWIDVGGGTNFTDAQYEAYRSDPDRIIESYILFEHFVTDGSGAATKRFRLDSSLHVIWSQELNSRSPGAEDSAICPYTFAPDNPAAYETPSSVETTQHLWLEHEWVNPRPAIGEARLPAGDYVARVVLTEESFHQSGLGGTWATVLSGDVDFEVEE